MGERSDRWIGSHGGSSTQFDLVKVKMEAKKIVIMSIGNSLKKCSHEVEQQ